MEAKKYGLSDFQLFSVLICAMLGSGIITLSRAVADIAGRDGWLSILLAGAGTWVMAILIWLLCKKFPTKTLPEFSIAILGKPLGILVSVAYFLYTVAIGGAVLRLFVELVKTWVLIWTPEPVFLLGMLLPVVYVSRSGAITLGRLMEIVTLLTVVVLAIWLVPAAEFNLLNLRPVGAEGITAIFGGAQEAIFTFLGFEVLLVFFPFVINRNKVLRITLMALGVITLLYAGNVILIFGVLGVEQTVLQKWPLINYLRVGMLPFLQRVDSLVLFFWTAQVTTVAATQYFAGTFTLATLTKRRYHDIWSIACWPLVYLVAIAPPRLNQVIMFIDFLGRWGLVGIMALVLLLLLVAKVRGLDESKEEKKP